MMLDFLDLAAGRQQLVEMTLPLRRVFASPIAARLGPIEHRFDSSANACGGLRFCGPDRLEHFHDQGDIDRPPRRWTEHWTDICSMSCCTMPDLLLILPRVRMRFYVGLI